MCCYKIKTFLFFCTIFFVSSSFAQDIGTKAPGFSFQTLDHGRISLSDFRGKVVYLFFLGYDCPPCIAEGPITESQINKVYGNKNFQAIGIDVWNGSINQMLTYKQQTGITYPLVLRGSEVLSLYQAAFDYSLIIDQDGIIRYKDFGVQTNQIKKMIESLLSLNDPINQAIISEYDLDQNYPNPFNSSTIIRFLLRKPQNVSLYIYDQTGRHVITLLENFLNFGGHKIIWDGRDRWDRPVASGNYFYVLQGNNFKETKKMTLIY